MHTRLKSPRTHTHYKPRFADGRKNYGERTRAKEYVGNFIARNEIKIHKLLVIKLGVEFTSERFLFMR